MKIYQISSKVQNSSQAMVKPEDPKEEESLHEARKAHGIFAGIFVQQILKLMSIDPAGVFVLYWRSCCPSIQLWFYWFGSMMSRLETNLCCLMPRQDNKVQKAANAKPCPRPGNIISTLNQLIFTVFSAFLVRKDFPKAHESEEGELKGPEKAGYMSSTLLFLNSILPQDPSR